VDQADRFRASDEFVRRLGGALRGAQLYAPTHPVVRQSLDALSAALDVLLDDQPSLAVGMLEEELIVGDLPMPKATESMVETIRRLKALGIERIAFERGVEPEELATFVFTLSHPERRPGQAAPGVEPADPNETLAALPHIRVGRIHTEQRVEAATADMGMIRKMYTEASAIAQKVWDSAQAEGIPDPRAARAVIDQLAQAVTQNRTALIALTALKEYDNYTFTHMVNVSILTLAQARGLGVDGTQLREFGLAALMHDIGKIRTPSEILNKPEKLTDDEFAIMRMHVVDGAEILRRTPEMPAIAPVVAFEHHLRIDGTGYPFKVSRTGLNVVTMMCGIADVYDAMRSQRAYQQAFPSDRILAVLKRNDGQQFDQQLVRRFTQLLGIYPPGTLVRLDTGAVGVVIAVHAPDPYRPRVKVLVAPGGARLALPVEVNLWEADAASGGPQSVEAPLDPAEHGIDPLTYL